MDSRRGMLGPVLAVSFLTGIAYGLFHALATNAVYHDPHQPSPAMAALAPFVLGFVFGIIALPVFAAVSYRLALRDSGMNGCASWFLLALVCGVAWIGAFWIAVDWG